MAFNSDDINFIVKNNVQELLKAKGYITAK